MSDLITIDINSLHNKSERIAAALFLVSNTMPDGEVLKTKIRNLSLEIVSICVSLRDNTEVGNHHLLKDLEKKILELVSFLNITSISGLVSEMNACILKKELETFLSSVSTLNQSVETGKFAISREFFEAQNGHSGFIKDSENYVSKQLLLKDKIGRKNQRNKAILNLISRKESISIKEIASFIKGCSEKTVQRELNILIKNSLIKKVGERRWSRYSLV